MVKLYAILTLLLSVQTVQIKDEPIYSLGQANSDQDQVQQQTLKAKIMREFKIGQSIAQQKDQPHLGYEDQKRWQEKQEKLAKQAEIIKNGGKIEPEKQQLRDNQEQLVTVHMVPHSHDDVGWCKTVDEYFTGANMGNQHSSVRSILTSVVNALAQNETLKFTYVETGFLKPWYLEQSQEKRDTVKKLIKNKQLEIVNGGWSANDEATPHFDDIINNMMVGHQFLLEEFGIKPEIGWDIDTFGHSDTNTRLFSEMGFDAMFFSRLDHNDKHWRSKNENKAMTFLWRPGANHFGQQHQILTYVWPNDYCYPTGFFAGESYDTDDVFQPDQTLTTFNADEKMIKFVNYVQAETHKRKGSHILVPMGCDFAYQNAKAEFEALNQMIEYINLHNTANIKLVYSTPSDYVKAVREENITWPVRYEDAMPYSEGNNDFWTGYFTSRPGAKKQIRDASALMNAQEKIFSQRVISKNVSDEEVKQILALKEEMLEQMGTNMHHDAITGTAKQYVARDYAIRLNKALEHSQSLYKKELEKIMFEQTGIKLNDNIKTCINSQNDTVLDCPVNLKENRDLNEFLVIVHNQANKANKQYSRIRLPFKNYVAKVWKNNVFEDVPQDLFEQAHFNNSFGQFSDYELYVYNEMKPNEITFLKIQKQDQPGQAILNRNSSQGTKLDISGFNEKGEVIFKYQNKAQNFSQSFAVSLKYYKPHVEKHWHNADGSDVKKDKLGLQQKLQTDASEGAYVLRPEFEDGDKQFVYSYSQLDQDVIFQGGSYMDQYTILFNNKTTNEEALIKVRFSPTVFEQIIEFEVELNAISISQNFRGKDLIVNWQMLDGFDPKQKFWTDSNSLQMIERNLYKRVDPRFIIEDKYSNISGNYYPVDSAIAMRDQTGKNLQVTIMNDRAQGGSADLSGKAKIELMQHRRITEDDNKGVIEILNEVDNKDVGIKVTAKYWMQIFDFTKDHSLQRQQQILVDQPLEYLFAFKYEQQQGKSMQTSQAQVDYLVQEKQNSVTFHTFPLGKNKILVRFENIADRFDSDSEIEQLDMTQFANSFYRSANPGPSTTTFNITEVSLTNNQAQSALDERRSKLIWIGEDDKSTKFVQKPKDNDGKYSLEPMRIRTFVVQYFDQKPISVAEEEVPESQPIEDIQPEQKEFELLSLD